ncbi:MAG: signal recognition particle receptor subunit alpha, partial [Nanoarchaeota archaeon]|nr:signal recognition particle receptor subunit alpha [Nanoarchaeota archaeon]
MVLDKLGSSLKAALKKVASAFFIDTRLIDEIIKDLQRALLESDVDVELVFELSERIKEKARKEPTEGISKREQLIKIVHDELIELLGKEKCELAIKKPHKIMFVGLYGSGKTTSISKLAFYYSKRGYKACMIGLDTHRPAAPEQLKQLGE